MNATRVEVSFGELAAHAAGLLDMGYRLALVAAHDDVTAIRVVYVFTAGPPDRRVELFLRVDPVQPAVPSLAGISFAASRFEREMRDLYGVEPTNHPMPRPLVHHPHWPVEWHPMRHNAGPRPAVGGGRPFPFLTVEGDGVYEIPVGPVHAGLIEPGHFRFSVVGETILKMKARLWYVHKGIEKLFEGRSVEAGIALAERVSGDTAVGHTLAYCLAVESALGITVPDEVQRIRAALLELERLHNHIADIGALCNDVAYGIAHAHAQRIRERMFRLNKQATGHRLLRGGVFPGGAQVLQLPSPASVEAIADDIAEIASIALRNSVIRERFTGTAVLKNHQAHEMSTLGVVAKASGLIHDARLAHAFVDIGDVPTLDVPASGDVLARFLVRAAEIQSSALLLARLLPDLPSGRVSPPVRSSGPGAGIGLAEGWRGTIAHRVEVTPDGHLTRVKIVDPSFFNWPALPVALADTIVPDFPLANKSFNLSYAANDL